MDSSHFDDTSLLPGSISNRIWTFSILAFLIGITIETVSALADGILSSTEFSQLLCVLLLLISWLQFKPEFRLSNEQLKKDILLRFQNLFPSAHQQNFYLHKTQSRMLELHNQHIITQDYVLPVPYLCQIYHLLNLKHLEEVHSFSLSNLRIVKVSDFQATEIGGRIKFQTILESSVNALRLWRQPIVEVDLILHTPHLVELSIPVYNDRRIIVLFHALPLNQQEHKLSIDIYSNLPWPKPILQIMLHIASCLTLFEDLPYLQKLAERNIDRLIHLNKISNHDTMKLFKRFVDLYGFEFALPTSPTPAMQGGS